MIAQAQTVDRSVFNYELTSVVLTDDFIEVKGWGIVLNNHNLYDETTHQFSLRVQSGSDTQKFTGELISYDMSHIMEYRGYPLCSDSDYYRNNCNYSYKNVGFHIKILLSELKTNHTYQVYLEIHTKKNNKTFSIPLFYPQVDHINRHVNNREISIQSNFDYAKLTVFAGTLVARLGPSPSFDALHIGEYCSSTYQNSAFFRPGATFTTIVSRTTYQDAITYFAVKVKEDGCLNQRKRVIESPDGMLVYLPSTFVNYQGDPLTITIIYNDTLPIISARDIEIRQYSHFRPLDHATAQDDEDGDITHKLSVISNTVNTAVPGDYKTCYEVTDSSQQKASSCINVRVIKRETHYRYISKYSLAKTDFILWTSDAISQIVDNQHAVIDTRR